MKRIFLILCLSAGLAAGALVARAATAPDELVRQTADEVISQLTENRETLEKDPEKLYQMVNDIVLPHFDFERMSRFVLGKHWRDATPEQQEKFVAQFKTLLVRTYATALFEYTGQEIVYKPFRHEEGDKKAVVKTEIQPADGPAIPIEYALAQRGEEWKVFDVRIDGLSLVTNYRSQYGRIVQSQGVDELIASLTEKNERLMSEQ